MTSRWFIRITGFLTLSVALLSCAPAQLETGPIPPPGKFNATVRKVVASMPKGGGYSVKADAFTHFSKTLATTPTGTLNVTPSANGPTFCTAATYQVLLKALYQHGVKPDADTANLFLNVNLADGNGIWGRWNSNGPAVAKLVKDLGAGQSFDDINLARPGDFAKIFWTDEIGSRERGHLVVFLGHGAKTPGGPKFIRFWSGNLPGGLGVKDVEMSRVKWVVFTRISQPEKFTGVNKLPESDPWLADMLKRPVSKKEVARVLTQG